MSIKSTAWGTTANGEEVKAYTLENAKGMKVVVLNFGANITEVHVPDKTGVLQDIVWGYENLDGYENANGPGFGSPIGRNANRIGNAEVVINGITYPLAKNDGENNLHSEAPGYNKRMWKSMIVDDNKIEFTLQSPKGDQGFPGAVAVKIAYTLTDDNGLRIDYEAAPDEDTVINLTNHSYFNLEGALSDNVLEHKVWIDADTFTPTDAALIPTGEIQAVEGTPMDFRQGRVLGTDIDDDYEPLKIAGGYDHNFVLNNGQGLAPVAKMTAPKSGITMEVSTDLPGLQLYTANFLDQEAGGKDGKVYTRRSAACFESQAFPDAVHHGNFPTTIVKAGETYKTATIFKFSCER